MKFLHQFPINYFATDDEDDDDLEPTAARKRRLAEKAAERDYGEDEEVHFCNNFQAFFRCFLTTCLFKGGVKKMLKGPTNCFQISYSNKVVFTIKLRNCTFAKTGLVMEWIYRRLPLMQELRS